MTFDEEIRKAQCRGWKRATKLSRRQIRLNCKDGGGEPPEPPGGDNWWDNNSQFTIDVLPMGTNMPMTPFAPQYVFVSSVMDDSFQLSPPYITFMDMTVDFFITNVSLQGRTAWHWINYNGGYMVHIDFMSSAGSVSNVGDMQFKDLPFKDAIESGGYVTIRLVGMFP